MIRRYKIMQNINLFKVRMSDNAAYEVAKVLNSGYIGQGSKVEELEDKLKNELRLNTRPITVNSCTSAIDLALELCGVDYNSEVISTCQTCYASNAPIISKRATIKWADIDPITGLIDPVSVEKLITNKTKAIVAVDWAGKFCDYKKLKSFGIPVIEDAAHVWDVFEHQEERGDYICYSFQAIKFLTGGDGGLLITPEDKYKQAKLMRWYGLDRDAGKSFRCQHDIVYSGYKYHMNDIAATIILSNIDESSNSVKCSRENSKYYIEHINNKKVILPEWDETCSYWLFSMHVVDGQKQRFMQYLTEHGIESSPVHYRNDDYTCTKNFKVSGLHGVDSFTQTQVCIPNGWWLSEYERNYIVDVINRFE